MLIFLNKYIGNFEKWIKFIEFSLKTTKEFNSYLSFFIMFWNIYLEFYSDNILRLRNRVNTYSRNNVSISKER